MYTRDEKRHIMTVKHALLTVPHAQFIAITMSICHNITCDNHEDHRRDPDHVAKIMISEACMDVMEQQAIERGFLVYKLET